MGNKTKNLRMFHVSRFTFQEVGFKFHVSRFKIALLLSFALVSINGFAWAQDEPLELGLAVSPQIFELDVFLGETISKRINLKNKSKVAMPIAVRVTDFTAAEETGEMLFDESSQDISFTSRKWFKIENPNFILEPEGAKKINFTISVPQNAEPGGHYAVMLFEPRLPSFYFEEGQPRAIPVIGVLFLFSVKTLALEPKTQQRLEIIEFSLPKEQRMVGLENLISSLLGSVAEAAAEITIIKKSPSNFILRIKNNDIYHIKPFGKVLIYNIFGKKVGETEVPQRTILPGKIRKFPVEFSPKTPKPLKWLPASISYFLAQNFFIGKYQAKLVLEAKTPLSSEILKPDISVVSTFFSLPWQFWLATIFIIGLFIFVLVKYKERIKLSLKVLIKKHP